MRKWISTFLLVLLLIPCVASADLTVYFLDVGQGDCAIIECDGEAMIIDAPKTNPSSFVYSFVKNRLALQKLEYMIATHPHEDHISGLTEVLNAVPVETIYSPVTQWESKEFQEFKKYADKQGTPISCPDPGEYKLGNATFTIFPYNTNTTKPNQMSICIRLVYGETSFLFAADVEGYAAYNLGMLGSELKSTVMKVSHHGSKDPDALDLINIVEPIYAVISCGKNQYGHPHQSTLSELRRFVDKLYRTDLQGTIKCTSDGHTVTFETEKKADSDVFTVTTKNN